MSNSTPLPYLAISINGQLFQGEEIDNAGLSPTDRGALLGDGLFETLPILQGRALWWDRHCRRLADAANSIGLPLDIDHIDEMVKQMQGVAGGANCALRLTVTRGVGGRGLSLPEAPAPTIICSLSPLAVNFSFQDVRLATSTIRRNELSPTSSLKSLGYLDNILATREAQSKEADDALLLNTRGNVACTTICNLFMLMGDRLITPPVRDGILPGILREVLLEEAPALGLSVEEASIEPEQLKKADGLFLTNSLRIMRRVTHLDGNAVGDTSTPDDTITRLQYHLRDLIITQTGIALG
ncbi:branched-chain amino acid aminotransferase [Cohaesibacter sp. ES.047]|uniref:aminotransferase class IV n=1 Tax=Cohaesibacter sp. ES.047 TaxID=1798205 RepID=UPI000BBF4A4D|nr:aminotransferase class IV [Cohaesibacter sp. ES.047]SNY93861.1 branched-chain amino acid aminotransferase [Cohaesibacter sp. ES.047]